MSRIGFGNYSDAPLKMPTNNQLRHTNSILSGQGYERGVIERAEKEATRLSSKGKPPRLAVLVEASHYAHAVAGDPTLANRLYEESLRLAPTNSSLLFRYVITYLLSSSVYIQSIFSLYVSVKVSLN